MANTGINVNAVCSVETVEAVGSLIIDILESTNAEKVKVTALETVTATLQSRIHVSGCTVSMGKD